MTEDMQDKVRAQKLLHPLTGKLKMMSKTSSSTSSPLRRMIT